jgi:hypothetical protein
VYEIAWNVKKLTPTGSAIVSSGSGAPRWIWRNASAKSWTKKP